MKKSTVVKLLVIVLAFSLVSTALVGCKKSSYQKWKDVLKEYDEWADDYVAFMKKYKANPADISLLSDYSKLMSEYSSWTNKLAEIENDKSLTEAQMEEIVTEYNRITLKLTQALY